MNTAKTVNVRKILIAIVFVFLLGLLFVPKGDANVGASTKTISGSKSMETVTQVKASHILVDTKKEAEDLKQRIDKGESFENLAKEYSKCPSGKDGGDLGFFKKGQMVQPFEKAAFETPVGKVSEPVQTQFGWHLIKVTDAK